MTDPVDWKPSGLLHVTHCGLTVAVREPIHGDDPRANDDPYVMSQAVPIILSSPSARGLKAHRRRELEASVRRGWLDPTRTRIVATLESDPDLIVGFAWGHPAGPVIDYLHVRGTFRGQGLGTLLARLLSVNPLVTAAVSYDTNDLSRPKVEGSLPLGLLHTGRWPRLSLRSK